MEKYIPVEWYPVPGSKVHLNASMPGYELRLLPVCSTSQVWELWHGTELVHRHEVSYAESLAVQDSQSRLEALMLQKAQAHAAQQP